MALKSDQLAGMIQSQANKQGLKFTNFNGLNATYMNCNSENHIVKREYQNPLRN